MNLCALDSTYLNQFSQWSCKPARWLDADSATYCWMLTLEPSLLVFIYIYFVQWQWTTFNNWIFFLLVWSQSFRERVLLKLFQLVFYWMNPPAATEWEGAQLRPKHAFCSFTWCFLLHVSLSCSVRHGPIWESLGKWIYKCDALKRCRYCQITVNIKQCATKCSMSVEPEIQTDPHSKVLLTDHKLQELLLFTLAFGGMPSSRIFRAYFPVKKYSWTQLRTRNYRVGRTANKLPEPKGHTSPPCCSQIQLKPLTKDKS